ncbi:MAG: ABC transporter permease [Candidatus Lactobacillus pullistercoris]|uniref:ABC transporter permease n=1 Tax=Candidatus Lactobacillus pullistercoris TaxID=2838636 RepID=A0A9E2KRZ8_9LACO|nr:ABC transporter permease [Candidatus Lactobacillus pullistercoris]
MRELAKKRLSENLKQSVKYLTLVFNDFFILALIFLFGALMFWYAQAMKTMPSDLWFYKPLVGLIMWLPLLTGHLVTLLKDADMQFLFTQDAKMSDYLKLMIKYSMVLPTILIVLLGGILFPFATIKAGITVWSYALIVIGTILLKGCMLLIEKENLYFYYNSPNWLSLVITLAVLLIGSLGSYIYPIEVVVMMIIARLGTKKDKGIFDWRYAVESEKARKDRVYSIFSMFTDVAEKQVTIKRRKYLDFLLPKSIAKENPNLFLYRRSLLRNPEYLNLLVRMTVFAVLISWLVQDWRWALGLSCLVIFLTVYQLLPMATEFDSNIMYRVYPIVRDNRGKDLVKVLNLGLLIQWLLISILWLILLQTDVHLWASIVALFVFTMIINYGYLLVRVKQQKIKR